MFLFISGSVSSFFYELSTNWQLLIQTLFLLHYQKQSAALRNYASYDKIDWSLIRNKEENQLCDAYINCCTITLCVSSNSAFFSFLLNKILLNASWSERLHITSQVSFADSIGIDPDILKIIGIFGCVVLRGDLNGGVVGNSVFCFA